MPDTAELPFKLKNMEQKKVMSPVEFGRTSLSDNSIPMLCSVEISSGMDIEVPCLSRESSWFPET